MSIAESAWMPSPRRPGYRVASYSSSTSEAIGNGSRPTTRSRMFRLQTCRSGCSMNARTRSAGASASPMPVRPVLVREPDDDSIGGAVAVARVDGRRDDGDDLEAGDRRAHGASLRSRRRARGAHWNTRPQAALAPPCRVGMVGSDSRAIRTFVQRGGARLPRSMTSSSVPRRQHDPGFPRLQCMWSARARAQAEPAGQHPSERIEPHEEASEGPASSGARGRGRGAGRAGGVGELGEQRPGGRAQRRSA